VSVTLFEAADVAEAVTVLKKIAVDLLIYDIRLIDGTVLAQLAKEHQPTTRIIWMAASQSRQTSVGTAARSLRLSLSNPAPHASGWSIQ